MAPESCSDGIYSPMSDIWSYGVLLYEMITFGSFPYQGLSNSQVLSHVKAGNTLSVPHGIKHQLWVEKHFKDIYRDIMQGPSVTHLLEPHTN